MTTTSTEELASDDVDEAAVAAYLRAHPDFFQRNPEVLTALEVPHRPGERAVSLIERQVAQLRTRNADLEQRLSELMRAARANERVGNCLLGLGRGLLEADSIDAVFATVRETLLSDSGVDEVALRLLGGPGIGEAAEPGRYLDPEGADGAALAEPLAAGAPVCGSLTQQQIAALFRGRTHAIASAALVPLRAGEAIGVLGLASRDPEHFKPDMGTLFLGQLGELVAAGLRPYRERA
jgi:uncharacterized protein YigA (DUF484 family)